MCKKKNAWTKSQRILLQRVSVRILETRKSSELEANEKFKDNFLKSLKTGSHVERRSINHSMPLQISSGKTVPSMESHQEHYSYVHIYTVYRIHHGVSKNPPSLAIFLNIYECS
jgi:hypothetical protein